MLIVIYVVQTVFRELLVGVLVLIRSVGVRAEFTGYAEVGIPHAQQKRAKNPSGE